MAHGEVENFVGLFSSWNQVGDTLMNDDCDENFGNFVRLTHDEQLLVTCGNYGNAVVFYYEKLGTGDEYVLQQSIRFDGRVNVAAIPRGL